MRPRAYGTHPIVHNQEVKKVLHRPLASTTLPVPRAVFLDVWTLDATATLSQTSILRPRTAHAPRTPVHRASRTDRGREELASLSARAPPQRHRCASLSLRAPQPPCAPRAACAACAHCSLRLEHGQGHLGSTGYEVSSTQQVVGGGSMGGVTCISKTSSTPGRRTGSGGEGGAKQG